MKSVFFLVVLFITISSATAEVVNSSDEAEHSISETQTEKVSASSPSDSNTVGKTCILTTKPGLANKCLTQFGLMCVIRRPRTYSYDLNAKVTGLIFGACCSCGPYRGIAFM